MPLGGRRFVLNAPVLTDPVRELGGTLLELWDAERTDLITIATGVSAWTGSKAGLQVTQGTGAAQPVWSATSFGGRPGITFDGMDDTLTLILAAQFPAAGDASEIWVVLSNTADSSDATARHAVTYGVNSGANNRTISRAVVSSVVRHRATVGDGTTVAMTGNTEFLNSRHVVRLEVGATHSVMTVDGVRGPVTAVVPATTATRFRIGSSPVGTPTLFWQGQVAFAAVTLPMPYPGLAKAFENYLLRRRGL
jgi:hypothetical protein